jgi:hypothetical protein
VATTVPCSPPNRAMPKPEAFAVALNEHSAIAIAMTAMQPR